LNPTSISIDPDGNLYIADNATIRKVNTSGIITTVAGTGIYGYQGDGGLAVDAQLALVSGIAFDDDGNYYFSQYYADGDVIRKVTSDGYISTVAGIGVHGMAGDDGAATHGQLAQPGQLALDPAGFIYIPDTGNKRVRRVALDGYNEEDVVFAESSGIAHLISAQGLHTRTYDLETGKTLLELAYDSDGHQVAITSPDGLVTHLSVDADDQLTQITYPDS